MVRRSHDWFDKFVRDYWVAFHNSSNVNPIIYFNDILKYLKAGLKSWQSFSLSFAKVENKKVELRMTKIDRLIDQGLGSHNIVEEREATKCWVKNRENHGILKKKEDKNL